MMLSICRHSVQCCSVKPDESVGKIVNDWSPDDDQNPEELGTYLEGDMLIPSVEGRNGLVATTSRWPNGVVPYVISPSLGSSGTNMILKAMDEYHAKTCIRFVPRTSEKDYLSIESSSTGCWSSVGKVGKRQSVNLQNPGCLSKVGTPIHELMHALGFLHEQNRNDRDSYIRVIKSNIKPDTLANFEKAGPGETTAYGVQYDTGSVMHYSSTAFSRNGQKTIEALRGGYNMGQRDGFAQSDIEKLNVMYKCGDIPSQGSSMGGYTNPVAGFIGGVASIFQALGGKSDATEDVEATNDLGEA